MLRLVLLIRRSQVRILPGALPGLLQYSGTSRDGRSFGADGFDCHVELPDLVGVEASIGLRVVSTAGIKGR